MKHLLIYVSHINNGCYHRFFPPKNAPKLRLLEVFRFKKSATQPSKLVYIDCRTLRTNTVRSTNFAASTKTQISQPKPLKMLYIDCRNLQYIKSKSFHLYNFYAAGMRMAHDFVHESFFELRNSPQIMNRYAMLLCF